MSTALAVVDAKDEWTKERVEVVKRQLCPSGITDTELAVFIEVCKRSGLDPFQKEIFCVPRRVNVGSKDSPKWIQKHEAQPAEAGLLARADRFPDFRGIKAAAIYEGDTIEVTEDGVRHSFNPAKRNGQLVGAWAQAFREGKVFPVEVVRFVDYKQPTSQWTQKPDTMIVKCARAAALRRAYPNAFSGLYLREEMPSEEFEAPAADVPVARGRGLAAIPSRAVEAPKPEVAALPAPNPLASLPMDELATQVMELEEKIRKHPKARNRPDAEMRLASLQAEIALRRREVEEPPADEVPPPDFSDAPPGE